MPGTEAATGGFAAAMGTFFVAGCIAAVWVILRSLANPPPWHRRTDALVRRPWQSSDLILILCLVATGQVLTASIGTPEGDEQSWPYIAMFAVQTVLAFHGPAALAIWLLFKARRLDRRRAFGVRRGRSVRETCLGLVGYLASLPAVTLLALLGGLLLNALNQEQSFQDVVKMVAESDQSPILRAYLCLLAVVVAPIVEEMLFRGIALPVLTRHLGFPLAVTIISAFFAFLHFHIWSLAPLFAISVAFSVAYLATGSLRVPIVMHAAFNAVNLINVLLFPDVVNDFTP